MIAGATKATSLFLAILHETYPSFTIDELREVVADRTKYVLNPEAIEVLDVHIKHGYGKYVPDLKMVSLTDCIDARSVILTMKK